MKLYVVAGEASGDARGTELMRALRERLPGVEFAGAGGREMRRLGGDAIEDWADEAVVGLWDVLKKYGYFRQQFHRMLDEISRVKPDALVTIDYPGFNMRLAKAAKSRMPTLRTIHYISPQVWAWHRGRIPKMAKFLDLMLCLFPFELPLYEGAGLRAVLVGHPLLDSLAEKLPTASASPAPTTPPPPEKRRTDESQLFLGLDAARSPAQFQPTGRDPSLVALLPGSRAKEVRKIFPVMIATAARLRQTRPALRFEAAAASEALAAEMRLQLELAGHPPDFCAVSLRTAHDLMQRAGAGMVCSGTATLESTFFGLPMVILYKVAWLTWAVGKCLVKIPWLGLPNVLAGREIIREFLQADAKPEPIAAEMLRLLDDPTARETQQRAQEAVIASLGPRGAALRAAEAIATALEERGP
jgi:lipid-A-disaccharide synthase